MVAFTALFAFINFPYSVLTSFANLMEAKVAIAGDLELFHEINKAKEDCPKLETIVVINIEQIAINRIDKGLISEGMVLKK